MEILFLLIAFSLFVAIIFLAAFIWAIRTEQYEDEYGDAIRILHDESPVERTSPDRTETEISISHKK